MRRNNILARLKRKVAEKEDVAEDINKQCLDLMDVFLQLKKEFENKKANEHLSKMLQRYRKELADILFTNSSYKFLKTTNLDEQIFINLEAMGLNDDLGCKLAKATKPTDDSTCLHHAAFINSKSYVNRLIKLGANVNAKTKENITPLLSGADCFDDDEPLEILQLLVKNGAQPHCVNQHNESALLFLVNHDFSESLRYALHELKLDPNKPNKYGNYPIHLAIERKKTKALKELLEYGVCMDVKNEGKESIMDLAKNTHNKTIIDLICEYIQTDTEALVRSVTPASISSTSHLTPPSVTPEKKVIRNDLLICIQSGNSKNVEDYCQKNTPDAKTIFAALSKLDASSLNDNTKNCLNTLFITGQHRRALQLNKDILDQLYALQLNSLLAKLFSLCGKTSKKTLLQEIVKTKSPCMDYLLSVLTLSSKVADATSTKSDLVRIAEALNQATNKFLFSYQGLKNSIENYFTKYLYEDTNGEKSLRETYIDYDLIQALIALRFTTEFYKELLTALLKGGHLSKLLNDKRVKKELLASLNLAATEKKLEPIGTVQESSQRNSENIKEEASTQESIKKPKNPENAKEEVTPPENTKQSDMTHQTKQPVPQKKDTKVLSSTTSMVTTLNKHSASNQKPNQKSRGNKKSSGHLTHEANKKNHRNNPYKNTGAKVKSANNTDPKLERSTLASSPNSLTNVWHKEVHHLSGKMISSTTPDQEFEKLKQLTGKFKFPDPATFKATAATIDPMVSDFKQLQIQADKLANLIKLFQPENTVLTFAQEFTKLVSELEFQITNFSNANNEDNTLKCINLEEKFWSVMEALENISQINTFEKTTSSKLEVS